MSIDERLEQLKPRLEVLKRRAEDQLRATRQDAERIGALARLAEARLLHMTRGAD